MADALLVTFEPGFKDRCPVHNRLTEGGRCRWCWPDDADFKAAEAPPADPMTDDDLERFDRCLIRLDAQHKAATN